MDIGLIIKRNKHMKSIIKVIMSKMKNDVNTCYETRGVQEVVFIAVEVSGAAL